MKISALIATTNGAKRRRIQGHPRPEIALISSCKRSAESAEILVPGTNLLPCKRQEMPSTSDEEASKDGSKMVPTVSVIIAP